MTLDRAWELLGIASTTDEGHIRKAYAGKVRQFKPETHPTEFAEIREAYERVQHWVRHEQHTEALDTQPDVPAPEPAEPAPPTAEDRARIRVQELAQLFHASGDNLAMQLVRQQIAQVVNETVDDKLAYEGYLVHWLLSAELPSLAVTFEAARLLAWRKRLPDIAKVFGNGGAQRLSVLMDLANEWLFAVYFSSNPWMRRLLAPAPSQPVPWFGWAAHVQRAKGFIAFWGQYCAALQLPQVDLAEDRTVMARVNGQILLSTDIIFGILLASIGWRVTSDMGKGNSLLWLMVVLLVFVLGVVCPGAARKALSTAWVAKGLKLLDKVGVSSKDNAIVFWFVGAIVSVVMILMPVDPINWIGWGVAGLLALVFTGLVAFGIWKALWFAELTISKPWLDLQRASDSQGFASLLETTEPTWSSPALAERLQNLPKALKQEWQHRKREKAKKRETAKAAPTQTGSSSGSGIGNWWWIWLAVVLISNIAKR